MPAAALRPADPEQVRAFGVALRAKLDAVRLLREVEETFDQSNPLDAPHFESARQAVAEAEAQLRAAFLSGPPDT